MAMPNPPRDPDEAYADMENRAKMGEHHRTLQRETDEAVAGFVAWPAIAGAVIGATIGVLLGLVAAMIPGWGLSYWGGIMAGFFAGAVLGGMVGGRLMLTRAPAPGESYKAPGGPAGPTSGR